MKLALTTVAVAAALTLAAAGSAQAADCPNAAFRTGLSASLPECRAYEQVSPVDKGGNDVVDTASVVTIGSSGKVYYNASGSIANSDTVLYETSYLASRGADWTTRGTDPPLGQNDLILKATMGFSEDGTKAVVVSSSALAPGAIEGGANIYIRDLTQPASYRLLFATANRKVYEAFTTIGGTGEYWGGTDDLSTIAFTSHYPLTPDSLPEDTQNVNVRNLYLVRNGRIELASRDTNGQAIPVFVRGVTPPRFEHLLSADGTRIRFRSYNPGGTEEDYEYVSGQGASVSPAPDYTGGDRAGTTYGLSPDGKYFWYQQAPPVGPGGTAFTYLVVRNLQTGVVRRVFKLDDSVVSAGALSAIRLSPNGHRAVVQSFLPLTGVDNRNQACQDVTNGTAGYCGNLFTYDADAPDQGLTCVSCVPASQSRGDASFTHATSFIDGRTSRSILDDGRVFFDTPNRLVGGDANAVSDVYEYVPGAGPRLLSSGRSGLPATYQEVSEDGNDVFFVTGEKLAPQDSDELADLYTARVNGGIASQQIAPAVAGGGCAGDACRPSVTPTPARPQFGTSQFRALPQPPAPRFRWSTPSASALRFAGRGGVLSLPVKVNVAGRVSASLSGRLGGRRSVTVARASGRARKAGTVRLRLRLSKRARAILKREGRLALRLTVRFSEREGASARTVTFTSGRTASKNRGGAR